MHKKNLLFCTSYCDIHKSPFFFHFGIWIYRSWKWKNSFFKTNHKNHLKLKPFDCMNSSNRNCSCFLNIIIVCSKHNICQIISKWTTFVFFLKVLNTRIKAVNISKSVYCFFIFSRKSLVNLESLHDFLNKIKKWKCVHLCI